TAAHGTIDLEETLVEGRLVQVVEADAAVTDGEGQGQAVRPQAPTTDLDRDTALVGELQAVVHQAGQAAQQLLRIPDQFVRQVGRNIQAQVQPFAQGPPGEARTQLLKLPAQAERRRLGTQAASLQLGEDEDVVDRSEERRVGKECRAR